MHRSLITPLRTLALVTGLLLVASVLPSRWSSWVSRPAKATLTTLATPITRPTRWVAQAVRSPAPNWQLEGDRGALERQVLHWRSQYEEMRQLALVLREENAGLTQTREMLQARGDVVQAPAAVVAAVPTPTPLLTVQLRHRDGLRRQLPVADGGNFVGEVADVIVPAAAEVRLATGMDLMVQAIPQDRAEPHQAIERWVISPGGPGWRYDASRELPIAVGDYVHMADDRWPLARGLIVGRITAIDDHPRQPLTLHRVTIEPQRSLLELKRVAVLMRPSE